MSDPCSPRLTIEIANRQQNMPVDEEQLKQAVAQILHDVQILEGELSIAIVDNAEIHDLNRRFLQHDYATDVISFPLESDPPRLDGEIIASAEMAISAAAEVGWPAAAELLLYVIHGALHLVGHDDHDPERALEMRSAERYYLTQLGVPLPPDAGTQEAATDSSPVPNTQEQESP